MHLTEVLIERHRLRNPYDTHRDLWTLFPDDPGAGRDFLFRVDRPDRSGPAKVLLQSQRRPAPDGARVRILRGPRELRPRFRSGQLLRFALCANPTKRLSKERCRVPLIRHDERITWLEGKLRPGAEILDADVVAGSILYFRRKGRPGKIATVTFQGLLRVTDPDAFTTCLAAGIGPAKAFGCGLLSVAPA